METEVLEEGAKTSMKKRAIIVQPCKFNSKPSLDVSNAEAGQAEMVTLISLY